VAALEEQDAGTTPHGEIKGLSAHTGNEARGSSRSLKEHRETLAHTFNSEGDSHDINKRYAGPLSILKGLAPITAAQIPA
jgi:hypothetical protein